MAAIWRCLVYLKENNFINFNIPADQLRDQVDLWYNETAAQNVADSIIEISSSAEKINPSNNTNIPLTVTNNCSLLSDCTDECGGNENYIKEGVACHLNYDTKELPVISSTELLASIVPSKESTLNNSMHSLSPNNSLTSHNRIITSTTTTTSNNLQESHNNVIYVQTDSISEMQSLNTSSVCTEPTSKSLNKCHPSPPLTTVIDVHVSPVTVNPTSSLVRSFSLNELSSYEPYQFNQLTGSYFDDNESSLRLTQTTEMLSIENSQLEQSPEKSQSMELESLEGNSQFLERLNSTERLFYEEKPHSMEMSHSLSVEKPPLIERSHSIERSISLERLHSFKRSQSMERSPPSFKKSQSRSIERSLSLESLKSIEKSMNNKVTDNVHVPGLNHHDVIMISSTPANKETFTNRGDTNSSINNNSIILLDDNDDDSDDTKLENFFKEMQLESARKEEKAKQKVSRKSDSEEIEEEEESDDEKENRRPLTNMTESPLPRKKPSIRVTNNYNSPGSCSTPIFRQCGTPTVLPSPLITPSSCKSVSRNRINMVQELFAMFNQTVFKYKLPSDMEIIWNKRLKTTAGWCKYEGNEFNRTCKIELSNKVCDTYDRIRDTLIHELCHAANWIIDGVRNAKHGRLWKKWAVLAMTIHPDLPSITTKHNYEIAYKYTYQCTVCDYKIGRHSKSVNLSVARCPYCASSLALF